MKTAINVGNTVTTESCKSLKEIIDIIFTRGFENHMDQDTIRAALDMIGKVTEIKQITITNCHIKGDTVINTEDVD